MSILTKQCLYFKTNKTMSILQNLCLDFVFGGFELSVKMSSRAPPYKELFIRNSS